VVSFTPRPLYPQGKSPWYSLDRRLGGPQSRSGGGGGGGGEEKNSQPPTGNRTQNPDRPARSTALYRLSCHGSHGNVGVKWIALAQDELKWRSIVVLMMSSRSIFFLTFVFGIPSRSILQ
jgi:hypothetical protein